MTRLAPSRKVAAIRLVRYPRANLPDEDAQRRRDRATCRSSPRGSCQPLAPTSKQFMPEHQRLGIGSSPLQEGTGSVGNEGIRASSSDDPSPVHRFVLSARMTGQSEARSQARCPIHD